MYMISMYALVKKGIAVLFLPKKVLLIYLENRMKILGTAAQSEDGLFYIADQQELVPTVPETTAKAMRAMTEIAKENKPSGGEDQTKVDKEKKVQKKRA